MGFLLHSTRLQGPSLFSVLWSLHRQVSAAKGGLTHELLALTLLAQQRKYLNKKLFVICVEFKYGVFPVTIPLPRATDLSAVLPKLVIFVG